MRSLLVFFLCGVGILHSRAQGFLNFDFENVRGELPQPQPYLPMWLEWNDAVPGWSHSDGRDTQIVYYGSTHFGQSQAYLLMDAKSPTYAPGTHLAGKYSLEMMNGYGYSGANPGWTYAYIAQTGVIPADARSIRLLARGPFSLTLGGSPIAMISLGGDSYAGDITGLNGRSAELRIMNTTPDWTTRPPGLAEPGLLIVDNIQFSSLSVPEPRAMVVGLLFLVVFVLRRKE